LLWKLKAPLRVQILVWQLAQDICVLCDNFAKSANHLFFECEFSYKVWMRIVNWLGYLAALHGQCHNHLAAFKYVLPKKKKGIMFG
jgi:hypothetical protein